MTDAEGGAPTISNPADLRRELRSAVQSAEASQRGLLLTGNEIYLSPYAAAKTSANRQIDSLKRNLGDDPQFGAVLQRLGILVVDKFAEMASKRTTGPESIEDRNARILAELMAQDSTLDPDVIDVDMTEVDHA